MRSIASSVTGHVVQTRICGPQIVQPLVYRFLSACVAGRLPLPKARSCNMPRRTMRGFASASRELHPGLCRLSLSKAQLDALLERCALEGPLPAYEQLVETSCLEPDSAQSECVHTLQDLWISLRDHAVARGRWEVEVALVRKRREDVLRDVAARTAAAHREDGVKSSTGGRRKRRDRTTSELLAAAEPVDHDVVLPSDIELLAEPPMPLLPTHGCFIWGRVGGGKSLLMDLFVESCKTADGLSTSRVHFHEFMYGVQRLLHEMRQSAEEWTTRSVAQRIARNGTRVLAFDEFQITNISDALILETLFTALFDEGVAVVFTSNRPPKDLYKDGLNRHLAVPQFLELLGKFRVSLHELSAARDFRVHLHDGDNEVGSCHGPWRDFFCKVGAGGTADCEASLRSAFAIAAGTPCGTAQDVPVSWGRSLRVTEAAGGVGRFDFHDLCGTACNADDYLKLVEQFHTFIIANVPRFSYEQHNEARRFTNLVDCLYENMARLVISADAPPGELLSEMQTLASVSLSSVDAAAEAAAAVRYGALPDQADWVRHNPFSPAPSPIREAVQAATKLNAGVAPGDDASASQTGVAGVMAGALGSLQESGFAATRATSRLLHMQSAEYLMGHQRHRLSQAASAPA